MGHPCIQLVRQNAPSVVRVHLGKVRGWIPHPSEWIVGNCELLSCDTTIIAAVDNHKDLPQMIVVLDELEKEVQPFASHKAITRPIGFFLVVFLLQDALVHRLWLLLSLLLNLVRNI